MEELTHVTPLPPVEADTPFAAAQLLRLVAESLEKGAWRRDVTLQELVQAVTVATTWYGLYHGLNAAELFTTYFNEAPGNVADKVDEVYIPGGAVTEESETPHLVSPGSDGCSIGLF